MPAIDWGRIVRPDERLKPGQRGYSDFWFNVGVEPEKGLRLKGGKRDEAHDVRTDLWKVRGALGVRIPVAGFEKQKAKENRHRKNSFAERVKKASKTGGVS